MNVIKVLEKNKYPIDASTLVKKMRVNKTTVYRQLDKLVASDKVIEVELGDGKKRYELKGLDHHHHLICNNCGIIEDVEFDEKIIMDEVNSKTSFKIEKHNLEFFGTCVNCK